MQPGLQISVANADDYSLDLHVRASNERFAGSVRRVYSDPAGLECMASALVGFVESLDGELELELGAPDNDGITGSVRMHFQLADALGHVLLKVSISTAGWTGKTPGPQPECASFAMAVDPASVDRFARELRQLANDHSGIALLEMSG